ncbi:glutathione S-transferase N-terminal domain-containing protein [archaeon]|nr:glutathione S-transferase N-terminal domain-containing protein [archaeon]MBL7057678.1 glutathione S-transferase N-terminal domain-containing protein [Candidatus Woesearchaeota archaeon]
MELTLFIGEGCPYCKKVTNFIAENKINIPIKETWNNDSNQKELFDLAGKLQVPCLEINGKPMHESLDIIDKLREIFL